MKTNYKPEPFNLGRPSHLLAKDLLSRIAYRNNMEFGRESHADVEQLIHQLRMEIIKVVETSAAQPDASKGEMEVEA